MVEEVRSKSWSCHIKDSKMVSTVALPGVSTIGSVWRGVTRVSLPYKQNKRSLLHLLHSNDSATNTTSLLNMLGYFVLWNSFFRIFPIEVYVKSIYCLRYYFICDNWLAVDQADGMVDRILPVATPENMSTIHRLFITTTSQKFTEDHLWISVRKDYFSAKKQLSDQVQIIFRYSTDQLKVILPGFKDCLVVCFYYL